MAGCRNKTSDESVKNGKLDAATNHIKVMRCEALLMLSKFMLRKRMLKKLGIVLLAVSASVLLSSCLVDKQKVVEKIARKTDTLRIYQDRDWIEYNVTAIASSLTSTTTQYGTLRIQWNNTTSELHEPINNTLITPVLKETTTLTYDGNSEPDVRIDRYISQVDIGPTDPNQGSMILYAIDDIASTPPVHYWPYPDSNTSSTSPVISPVIFKSPLYTGSSFPATFSMMECDLGQCAQPIYNFKCHGCFRNTQ